MGPPPNVDIAGRRGAGRVPHPETLDGKQVAPQVPQVTDDAGDQ